MSAGRALKLFLIAAPVAFAAVIGVEIEMARRGPDLEDEILDLDGRVGPSSGPAETIVWLGDSTAAGVGASSAAGALPVQVARAHGEAAELRVLAISGARIDDVLQKQVPQLRSIDADRIYISVGANDSIRLAGKSHFAARYRELLRSLPEGVPVVALGVPDMGSPTRFAQPLRAIAAWSGRRLASAVRAEAERAGVTFVDIAGHTGPIIRQDPSKYTAPDNYHPSDAGYRLWTEAVVEAESGR